MVRSIVEKQVIDYTWEDFTKSGQSYDEHYDLILDCVGTHSLLAHRHFLQKDEGLFVTVMTLCGLRETPERRQLWTKSLRCFDRPIGGKKDLWAIASQLVPHPILRFGGKPYQKICPCKNPRVVAVLKKIVRGLAHYHCGEIISDKRVGVTHEPFPLFNELYGTLTTVYTVPHVFTGMSLFSNKPEVAGWHSLWVLDFLDNVRLFGWITGVGNLNEETVPYHLT
jgi:Zinc-binding dehydrogenase